MAFGRPGFGPCLALAFLAGLLLVPCAAQDQKNNKDEVFIERAGLLEKRNISFRDDKHLMQIIDRIVSAVGRRVDESSPMVDARLADGSRVNAIIPPLALDGAPEPVARDAGNPEGGGAVPDLDPHFRRNRRRKDYPAEHAVLLHSGARAHHHH